MNVHTICSLRHVAVPIKLAGLLGAGAGSRSASIGKAREPLVVEKCAAARSDRLEQLPADLISIRCISSSCFDHCTRTIVVASWTEMEAAKQTRKAENVEDRHGEDAELHLDGRMSGRAIVSRCAVEDPAHIEQSTLPMAQSCCAG